MGRRRRAAKKERKRRIREGIEEEQPEGLPLSAKEHSDAFTAVLEIQPQGRYAAIAYGQTIWLADRRSGALMDLPGSTCEAPVRALTFDLQAQWLMAAGDDKVVRVWQLSGMTLRCQWKCPKKVSAATFSGDGEHAIFADKFGDVYVAATAAPEQAPQLFLGHFCSIITSLTVSPDRQYIVSTDRDHKIRVSNMPAQPMQGAHDIASYCLGHTSFVTCATFVKGPKGTVLVTGGGDGTIRVWQPGSGQQLTLYTASGAVADKGVRSQAAGLEQLRPPSTSGEPEPASAGASELEQAGAAVNGSYAEDADDSTDEKEAEKTMDKDAMERAISGGGYESDDDDTDAAMQPRAGSSGQHTAAIIALQAAPDGSAIAAAVERQDTITVLRIAEDWALREQQHLSMPDLALPTALQFDGEGRLWALGRSHSAEAAHLKLVMAVRSDTGQDYGAAEGDQIPEPLQAAMAFTLLAEPGEQQDTAGQVNPQLRKHKYPEAESAFRKRHRRDIRPQTADNGTAL